jgi:hypothetical protein
MNRPVAAIVNMMMCRVSAMCTMRVLCCAGAHIPIPF